VNRTEKDALRILTVHGAKGLQAPIVMLIDTAQLPISRGVLRYDERENMFLCVSKRRDESQEYESLKALQKQKELTEYYRLLYVALTRAEVELHVFGAAKTKLSDDSWYAVTSKIFTAN
jgi:ATP-dependent helicase/nuclease subunit A